MPALKMPAGDVSELVAVARNYEPERYIAATLAPEPQRAALIALAAYAADLARVPATATQPMLGEIRLQWWRDSLDAIGNGVRIGSPVADALANAIEAYRLPIPMLVAMSEARAWDLYDDPMPDQAALDGYLAKTEAIPFELALRILGLPPGEAVRLSLPAGRLFGLVRLLAAMPEHLAKGRLPLPPSMLHHQQIVPETLLGGVCTPHVRALISSLAQTLAQEFASLRPQLRPLSRLQRSGLLPLAVVPAYLTAIQRPQRDPLRDVAALAPLTRVWRIARAHALGSLS